MAACNNCYGPTHHRFWQLTFGYRPGREPERERQAGYFPVQLAACDACVARIPGVGRRSTHGRLGAKTGRIVYMDRLVHSSGNGRWSRDSTDPVRGNQTVFLSVTTVRRFLPALLAQMEGRDAERLRDAQARLRAKQRR